MRLAGALAVLDEEGYDTVVCNVDTPQQRDHHLAALTKRHRADGVIVVSLQLSRQQLASFRHARVPLVTVDVLAPGVPQTVIDNVTGGRVATEHLLSLGHRRIGFVGDTTRRMSATNLGFTASPHRLTGYRQALAARPASTTTPRWCGAAVRTGERRGAGRRAAGAARPAVGHLRGVRHAGDGCAHRGGPERHCGSRSAVGDRLR